MIARSDAGTVAGVPVRFASIEDCLAVASVHIINDIWKGDPSLVSWRDVVVLTHKLGIERSRSVMEARGLAWLAALIFAGLETILERPPATLEFVSRPTRHDRRMSRRLRLVGWEQPTTLARHPIGWAARLPLSRSVAYLAGCAVPSVSYVRRRHGGYLSYWSLTVKSLRAARQGCDYRGRDVATLLPLHQRVAGPPRVDGARRSRLWPFHSHFESQKETRAIS
jgi:hypothetical protein